MEVPLADLEKLHALTSEISTNFGSVQKQWTENFDQQ